MAAAQLIDLLNYDTMLVQSTQGRAGTPNGNIYFNKSTGEIELITREELTQVDLGSGLEDNPLTNAFGITLGAQYAFERQERRTDEDLRKFDYWFRGSFKFAGAYEIVNGRKFAGTDRVKVRSSGWIERAANGNIDRIYFGVASLGNIEAASEPYYQLTEGGAPVDFDKAGPINESVQVFGSTANGDSGAGNFDSRTFLSNKVRSFGFNFDEKRLIDSGVVEMGGYSTGFALGESPHLTTGDFALADVYGGAQIAPWTGMTLERVAGLDSTPIAIDVVAAEGTFTRAAGSFVTDGFAAGHRIQTTGFTNAGNNTTKIIQSVTALVITVTDVTGLVNETGGGDERVQSIAQVESGFNEADGNFSWIVRNAANGSLAQCVAFLDALAQTDDDIDSGIVTITRGKRVGTWYTYDAQGRIVTRSGADSLGLFIENIPTVDEQDIVFRDDAGNLKTRPFSPGVALQVGSFAAADPLAWYHVFYLDGAGGADFNTNDAVTVNNNADAPVKGSVSSATVINWGYAYDTNTQAGLAAGIDKDMVAECEGDGGATQAKTVFTMQRIAQITVAVQPGLETNM